MWVSDNWRDYRLIDCGEGRRLERWGEYTLIRPDPQAVWRVSDRSLWNSADGVYTRSSAGGGSWDENRLPASWEIGYQNLTFKVMPTGFKHTGVFPEQAANWDFMQEKTATAKKMGREVNVLNLFAYTGCASMACLSAGASVCHVDASKGVVNWAKENAKLSGLENAQVRYIVDDCVKFVQRELRRNKRYDAIIMDPPSYGRGSGGALWKFEDDLEGLIELCVELLSEQPLFFIISSYTTGFSPSVTQYMLSRALSRRFQADVQAEEIGLTVKASGLRLPCGSTVRAEIKA